MDYAYRYADPRRLYLNVTNRCTNRCGFCVRNRVSGIGNGVLWGGPEPDLTALLTAVEEQGGEASFDEIVWCGFGEPTIRADLILEASPLFRAAGCLVRLNTNGHGNLITGRDLVPELAACVDAVSVSLNAPTCERYLELCRPSRTWLKDGKPRGRGRFWQSLRDFITSAVDLIPSVQASVVGQVLAPDEIERCRDLAASLGCTSFRVR